MLNRKSALVVGPCLVISFAAALLLGANGDGGCFESKAELCTKSGGTMVQATNWPTVCGDDPVTTPGPAVKAGEQTCACPADKPFWQDGYGCQNCASRCLGHATWCNSLYMYSDCLNQAGCHWHFANNFDANKFDRDGCEGWEQECWTFQDESSCNQQDGCSWK